MGRFALHEDRPTPKEVYNWRIYIYSFIAAFGAFLYGYDSAFIGGTLALTSFREEFGINAGNSANLSANIVSAYQAGAFFGALISFPFCERLGRKWTMLTAGAIFTLGACLHLISDSNTGLAGIYVGRAVGGVGVGAISLVVPIYIAEISPPAIRGRLVGLYEALLQLGGLLGFWINYAVNSTMAPSKAQWTIPIAIQIIPGAIVVIFGWLLVESPRWLRSKGRADESDRTLSLIRGLSIDHPYIQEEIAAVDEQLRAEAQKTHGGSVIARLKEIALPGIRNRFFIAFMLFLFQNATGINAINYYSPTVFRSIGIKGTNTGLLTTGVFGIVKNITTIIWLLFLIDHVGRRVLLLVGAAGASFCMFYIGAYVAIGKPEEQSDINSGGISAVAFIYIWTAFYGPTYNGTPWVIAAELFPQHIRTLVQSLLSASQWIWQFVIARATPYMFRDMRYGTYLFFASFTALAFVFVYFFVPETKGKTLEDMDVIFGFRKASTPHDYERGVEPRAEDVKDRDGLSSVNSAEEKETEERIERYP